MKQLFEDMLAAIIFLVVYLVSGDIFIATGVAIAAGLAQFGYLKIKRRPIDAMQWGSLALVIVLGGVTIATRDGRFIMMKPSIIHFAIAAINAAARLAGPLSAAHRHRQSIRVGDRQRRLCCGPR